MSQMNKNIRTPIRVSIYFTPAHTNKRTHTHVHAHTCVCVRAHTHTTHTYFELPHIITHTSKPTHMHTAAYFRTIHMCISKSAAMGRCSHNALHDSPISGPGGLGTMCRWLPCDWGAAKSIQWLYVERMERQRVGGWTCVRQSVGVGTCMFASYTCVYLSVIESYKDSVWSVTLSNRLSPTLEQEKGDVCSS